MEGALALDRGSGARREQRESSVDVSGSSPVRQDVVVERLDRAGLSPVWRGEPPSSFRALTDDSRQVREGDLFCAVRGLRADGHDYLAAASQAGASAAVVERADDSLRLPQLVVEDSRLALALLASAFAGDPSATVRVAGVTGTNGKTTTVWFLRHLFAARGRAASLGTLGVIGPDGERRAGDLTTPGPIDLARELAQLRDEGVERVAMEVSSHALDQRRVDGVAFDALLYTNLSREHLDYHRDMDAYRAAKRRAVDLLREGGVLAVHHDEPAWEGLDAPGARRVTFGERAGADVRAGGTRPVRGGTRFTLEHGGASAPVTLPMPGTFNVENALGAAALLLAEGATVEETAEALSAVPQIPGRMEVLHRDGALVVRDYAHTPDALRRAIETLRPEAGRLVLVFGCGGDRDPGKRPKMGRVAAAGADRVLVTTDNPRSEDPAAIADEVVSGMAGGDHEVVLDRRKAIARALDEAGEGDVVLLAGKGHETYQIVGEEKRPFDEARIVAELVGEGAP